MTKGFLSGAGLWSLAAPNYMYEVGRMSNSAADIFSLSTINSLTAVEAMIPTFWQVEPVTAKLARGPLDGAAIWRIQRHDRRTCLFSFYHDSRNADARFDIS